jgi:hypothetical protein
MTDGVKLSVTYYQPHELQKGEKFPIVLEMLPYRKDDSFYTRDYKYRTPCNIRKQHVNQAARMARCNSAGLSLDRRKIAVRSGGAPGDFARLSLTGVLQCKESSSVLSLS